jgi:hypothetical protein
MAEMPMGIHQMKESMKKVSLNISYYTIIWNINIPLHRQKNDANLGYSWTNSIPYTSIVLL